MFAYRLHARYDHAYVLLHVFLTCSYGTPAHLETHLRGRVVDEATKGRVHEVSLARLTLLLLLAITIAALLLTVLRGWWWRRAQLRHGRDMLRDGVVKRRAVGGRDGVGWSLHRGGACLLIFALIAVSCLLGGVRKTGSAADM